MILYFSVSFFLHFLVFISTNLSLGTELWRLLDVMVGDPGHVHVLLPLLLLLLCLGGGRLAELRAELGSGFLENREKKIII